MDMNKLNNSRNNYQYQYYNHNHNYNQDNDHRYNYHDNNAGDHSDGQILKILVIFSIIFLLMTGYMIYFIVFEAQDRIGSPYNKSRIELFEKKYIRGSILSRDGVELAYTKVSEDGKESRIYPYGEMFSHVIGYSTRGKTGLEKLCDFYLINSNLNPLIRAKNEILDMKSPGDNVVTTLDFELQSIAYEALSSRAGAVICMEPESGEILAMVSKPGFDPNYLDRDWESLTSEDNRKGNLLNRATQGLYPPGSTFKTLVALEYIRSFGNGGDFHFDCTGVFRNPDNEEEAVHCYEGEAHGEENLKEAYASSCNSAFSYIGTKISPRSLKALSSELLFDKDLPIDLPFSKSSIPIYDNSASLDSYDNSGSLDSSDNSDSSVGSGSFDSYDNSGSSGNSDKWEMMQTAIGQGEVLMTPLHNLLITSAIANKGVLRKPILFDEVSSQDGIRTRNVGESDSLRLIHEDEAEILKQYMRAVVKEGSGSGLLTDSYEAAGKTGSAEYMEGGKKKTYAWFTGFVPLEKPVLSVTVLVEDGETGGRTAVPVARKLMDYWMGRQAA